MRARVVRLAYCFAAFAIILMLKMAFPVEGQSTAQVCENRDSSSSIGSEPIVEEIGQLNIQLHSIREVLIDSNEERQRQQDNVTASLQDINIKQVQVIKEFFNVSFQQMKNQVNTAVTRLQADDRHSQDQIERIHQFLNASLLEMKNQQNTIITSNEAIDRRSQEQEIVMRNVQSNQEHLNASLLQMKNQQDTMMTSLHAVDRRSQEQDINIRKVQSGNEFLNVSFQQLKNQLNTAVTSLQAYDQCSQDQIERIHQFLNASHLEMRNQQDNLMTSIEVIDRRSLVQDIYMRKVKVNQEHFNASFLQMRNQQDTLMTSIQAIDLRSQEHNIYMRKVQSNQEYLNTSFLQMNNQQDALMTSIQAIDRRSQEQGIYMMKVHSNQEHLNVSIQQMRNQQDTIKTRIEAIDRRSQGQDIVMRKVQSIGEFLNTSLLQQKNQQETVLRKLEAFERRLHEHELSLNETQKLWKREIAYGTDLGEVPILPSIVNNWIVLMHRFDGSLNFNRNWSEYKNGFGDMRRGEFWIGNEKIHRLTNRFACTLSIEIQLNATGQWFYAEYDTFSVDSESNKYALHLSGFGGNAGDSLTNTSVWWAIHNGRSFTTVDADNDRYSGGNCAQSYTHICGWWFDNCFAACLTCSYRGEFKWQYADGWHTSGLLRASRMMIKTK